MGFWTRLEPPKQAHERKARAKLVASLRMKGNYEDIAVEDEQLIEGKYQTKNKSCIGNSLVYVIWGILILLSLLVIFSGVNLSHLTGPKPCTGTAYYVPFSQRNLQTNILHPKRGYFDNIFSNSPQEPLETPLSTSTQRFSINPGSILIENVTIWTVNANDEELKGHDVLVENGIITRIGINIPVPPAFNGKVIAGKGSYLTPGLVDMHSHVGVSSFPASAGLEDTNEATNPTTPQLRVVDAFYTEDPAINLIMSGGVTTSLVLPGSANVMGGQAAIIKMRGSTVEEFLVRGAKNAVKMACGENPKRVYGQRNVMPDTRLGIGWKFREMFHAASVLRAEQKVWDCNYQKGIATGVRPTNLQLDNLVSILEGNTMLMVHCYMVHDMEMMIRTSKEFNFTIKAFHHALEAWKIPTLLKNNNISVATFTSFFGFKMEGYDGSVKGVKTLIDGGVNTAIKTDHPIIYAKYFMLEAAKAFHYGLTWQQAIRVVTMNPAKAIELSERIGSIALGKDGDLALWDRYPLQIGARPKLVVIEGNILLEKDYQGTPPIPAPTASMTTSGPSTCTKSDVPLVVRGLTDASGRTNLTIVAQLGVITCYEVYPGCEAIIGPFGANVNVYQTNGAFVTPGFIEVDNAIGQAEVDEEANTQNGITEASSADFKISDGARLNNFKNRKIESAFKAGVTSIIGYSPPTGQVLAGQASAFYIVPGSTMSESLIVDSVALTVYIGNDAKYKVGSVSAEIQFLREQFRANTSPVIQSVLNGSLLLLAVVDQVDQIDTLLRLQAEFKFRMAIKGGAESHLVASKLAKANVSVILHSRAPPEHFETYHVVDDLSKRLYDAGVNVGISINLHPERVRNLRWEAGYAMEGAYPNTLGIPYANALAMITSNIAQIFGIQNKLGSVEVNRVANFVVFNGHPLSIQSRTLLVVASTTTDCSTAQFK